MKLVSAIVLIILGLKTTNAQEVYEFSVRAPEVTRTADVNNDGKMDIITASLSKEKFHVFLQTENQKVSLNQTINVKDLDTKAFCMDFEVGDFNGDKISDLVIFNDKVKSYFYLGRGDGSFQSGKSLKLGPIGSQIAIKANIDNNELDDLIISSDTIVKGVLDIEFFESQIQKNNLSFKRTKFMIDLREELLVNNFSSNDIEIDHIVHNEFTGDDLKDLIIVSTSNDFLILLKGVGDNKFEFEQILATYSGPTNPIAIDVNRDGISELFVSHYKRPLSVLFNSKDGKLKLQQSFNTGKIVSGVSVFEHDSKVIISALNYFDGKLKFYKNLLMPFFESYPSLELKTSERGMYLNSVDFDNDGKKDFIISDLRGNKISIIKM